VVHDAVRLNDITRRSSSLIVEVGRDAVTSPEFGMKVALAKTHSYNRQRPGRLVEK